MTSLELSAQGIENADPIAPAPIITIFFIKLLYVPEYKNSKEKRNNSCHP